MARKRMIDPGFWTDEKLGMMPRDVRLLFMGLISNADDEGRLSGHPALIRSTVFPYDDLQIADVEAWLQTLHDSGLITRYVVNEQQYIHVTNFHKHQTIKKSQPSKLPPPPDTTGEGTSGELAGNQWGTGGEPVGNQWGTSGELSGAPVPPNRREEKRREEKRTTTVENQGGSSGGSTTTPEEYWETQAAHLLNPTQCEAIQGYREDGFPDDVICAAMERALLAGKDLRYAFGILKNWRARGLFTLEAIEREERNYRERASPDDDVPEYARIQYYFPPEEGDSA